MNYENHSIMCQVISDYIYDDCYTKLIELFNRKINKKQYQKILEFLSYIYTNLVDKLDKAIE